MSEDPVAEGARGGQVTEVISHAAGGRSLRGLIIFMGDVMYF